MSPHPGVTPFVGDWAGNGWGWEIRFKSNLQDPKSHQQAMTLTVRHFARFDFTVDQAGNIVGDGEITYDLDPNLCGVARLTEQVNFAINQMAQLADWEQAGGEVVKKANEYFNLAGEFEEAGLQAEIDALTHLGEKAESSGKFSRDPFIAKLRDFVERQEVAPSYYPYHLNPGSTRDLATSVWEERCAKRAPIQLVGGLTCDQVLSIASPATGKLGLTTGDLLDKAGEKGKEMGKDKVSEEEFWKKGAEWLYEHSKGPLKETIKKELMEKTRMGFRLSSDDEKKEKTACEGSSTLRAGTSVGNATATGLAATGAGAAATMAMGGAPVGAMLAVPGVTQVQYEYKGLANGPESRRFKIRGQIAGDKLILKMDGDVYEGAKDLVVEYMVNFQKGSGKFPAWSPFIEDQGGDVRQNGTMRTLERKVVTGTCSEINAKRKALGAPPDKNCKDSGVPHEVTVAKDQSMSTPFATFHKTGEHRNNVKVWHEYEYFWNVYQITKPKSEDKT